MESINNFTLPKNNTEAESNSTNDTAFSFGVNKDTTGDFTLVDIA